MGANRLAQGRLCLGQPPLLHIEHRQIVMGLGQFRVITDQGFIQGDGRIRLSQFTQHHTTHKAGLGLLCLGLGQGIQGRQGLGTLPLGQQLLHHSQIGRGQRRPPAEPKQQGVYRSRHLGSPNSVHHLGRLF